MEPVKGGTLAKVPEKAEKFFIDYHPDMSIPSWAIRYVASHKGIMMVLTIEARKELLTEQRKQLIAKMEDIKKTLERLNYKIESYEQSVVEKEKELKRSKD